MKIKQIRAFAIKSDMAGGKAGAHAATAVMARFRRGRGADIALCPLQEAALDLAPRRAIINRMRQA